MRRCKGRVGEGVALVALLLSAALVILVPPNVSLAQDQNLVSFHGVVRDRLNQPRSIRVEDVIVEVPSTARIHDVNGNPVQFGNLQISQEVTVKGYPNGVRYMVAREIIVTPPMPK
ncbi:MAG TPA: hypothetical protein VJM80_03005 [bacterium]|nr:hypothetical protein [bacterium]